MPGERDKVHQLDDKRAADRLLAVLETHEQQAAEPIEQLVLEVDGETLATFEPGAADVSLRLPRRARSLTVRDQHETVRGFTLLDEEDLDVWELGDGQVELRFARDDDGEVRVTVAAAGLARAGGRVRAGGAGARPDVDAAGRQVVEAAPASAMAMAAQGRGGAPGFSRWLAAAGVMVLVGGAIAAYQWNRSYQDTQSRIAAQQAEQQRQQQELERLQRANEESSRKVAQLIDELKSARSEAERARIQAELEAEQAKAAQTGRAIRSVGQSSGGANKAKPACKPGDPLCSEM